MTQILLFLILLSGAFFMSLKFKKRIEETLPTWICTIIGICYLFGLFGILEIGVYTVFILAACSLGYSVYALIRYKKKVLKNILTPGLVVFFLFFALSWWAQRGRMLTSWDEFSHWGLTVKNMAMLDAFSTHPSAVMAFRGYPPATALFQYFFTKLTGSYIEGYLFQAMNMLYFGIMIYLLRKLKWKQVGQVLLRVVLIMILPVMFYSNFFTELYVDGILGILFAYALVRYYTGKFSTFNMLSVGAALFVLTLVKASGGGLAFIALVIIGIDLIVIQRKKVMISLRDTKQKKKIAYIIGILSPLFCTLFAKISWSIHLGGTQAWDTSDLNFNAILNVLQGHAEAYQRQTVRNFMTALTENKIAGYSFVLWFVIGIALSVVLIRLIIKKEERKRFQIACSLVIAGALIYCITLLLLYLFTYSSYEAEILASFGRYMGTYLLAMLTFMVALIIIKEDSNHKNKKIPCALVLCFLLLFNTYLTPFLNISIFARSTSAYSAAVRNNYKPISKIEEVADKDKDIVFFICAGTNGYEYNVARYLSAPVELYGNTWSLGEPYFEGDIWTKNINQDEWKDVLLKECAYVYVHRSHEYFDKNYGKLFEGGVPRNDTLYYVDKENPAPLLKIVE